MKPCAAVERSPSFVSPVVDVHGGNTKQGFHSTASQGFVTPLLCVTSAFARAHASELRSEINSHSHQAALPCFVLPALFLLASVQFLFGLTAEKGIVKSCIVMSATSSYC